MMYLSQVSFGKNSALSGGIVGNFYILGSLAYFIFMIIWLRTNRVNSSALALHILQLIFVTVLMLVCGCILIFQGWRLDPPLQLVQLLSFALITYLIIKDLVINAVYRNR